MKRRSSEDEKQGKPKRLKYPAAEDQSGDLDDFLTPFDATIETDASPSIPTVMPYYQQNNQIHDHLSHRHVRVTNEVHGGHEDPRFLGTDHETDRRNVPVLAYHPQHSAFAGRPSDQGHPTMERQQLPLGRYESAPAGHDTFHPSFYSGLHTSQIDYGHPPPLRHAAGQLHTRLSHQHTAMGAASRSPVQRSQSEYAHHHAPSIQTSESQIVSEGQHPGAASETVNVPLSLPSDQTNLSEYQTMIRAQIDLFEAGQLEVRSSAQGRNRPILLGQVGIRCKHCVSVPPNQRTRGAVYFPATLPALYQAAQNMATNHLTDSCRMIPPQVKEKIIQLRSKKTYMLGGGKGYWSTAGRIRNVVEREQRLFFSK